MDNKMIIAIAAVVIVVAAAGGFMLLNNDGTLSQGVAYEGNGGVTADGRTTVESAEPRVPNITFTREGYVFVGFCNSTDGNGFMYHAGDPVNYEEGQKIHLFAIWAPALTLTSHTSETGTTQLTLNVYSSGTLTPVTEGSSAALTSNLDTIVLTGVTGKWAFSVYQESSSVVFSLDGLRATVTLSGDGIQYISADPDSDVPRITFTHNAAVSVTLTESTY